MAHHGIAPIRIDAPFISVAAVFVEWFGFLKIKIVGVRFSEHHVNSYFSYLTFPVGVPYSTVGTKKNQ